MEAPRKISIFIPVYRESDLLESLLNSILSDPYPRKEIFVIIDEPTDKSLRTIGKFEACTSFVLNGKRKGRVNALNEAVKKSEGEILLFLDSDIFIPPGEESFLQVVSQEMKKADLIEIKKKIALDSFLAKNVHYDYLSFNSLSLMFSRMLGKCLGLNGAAFAIGRKTFNDLKGLRRVISEDLDIGTRAFMKDYRFRFVDRIEVYIKAPASWSKWFNQRKRWGLGAALWFKDHRRELLSNVRRHPKILLPSLFLVLPALPLFMINMLIPSELYFNFSSIILLLLATRGGGFLYAHVTILALFCEG